MPAVFGFTFMFRLNEQFLYVKFYLTIFVCWGKPRLHEQFLLKTKDWRLGSLDDKKMPILCVVSSIRTIFYM